MREHTGISIAIALVCVAFLATLPAALTVAIWLGFSLYAAIKAIGSAPDAPNATAIVIMVGGLVTVLAVGLGATIYLLGRSMTPKRRRRDQADELPFAELS
jgi:hypothetical protein